jgi:hypothetical protein
MKNRYRLISRGSRGGALYCVDGSNGKRTSLGACSPDEAEQIVLAKNQALRHPALNLQIARAYTTPNSGSIIGENLTIQMAALPQTGTAFQPAFDNVTLDATSIAVVPEPATAALLISGGFALFWLMRWRRVGSTVCAALILSLAGLSLANAQAVKTLPLDDQTVLVKDHLERAVRSFMLGKMFKHEAELRQTARQAPQAKEWLEQQEPSLKQRIMERLEKINPFYREKALVREIAREKTRIDFTQKPSLGQGMSV